jgi:hypothetical protein
MWGRALVVATAVPREKAPGLLGPRALREAPHRRQRYGVRSFTKAC